MKRLMYLVLGFSFLVVIDPILCMEQRSNQEVATAAQEEGEPIPADFNLEKEITILTELQKQILSYPSHNLRMTPQRMKIIKDLSQKSLSAVTTVLEYFRQTITDEDAVLIEDIKGLEAYKKQLERYVNGERISLTPDDIAAGLSFTIRILVYFQEKITPIIDATPAGTEPSAHTLTLKRWLFRSVILTTALAVGYYGGVWIGLWKGYHLLDFSALKLVEAIIHSL